MGIDPRLDLADRIGALRLDPLNFVRFCYPWGEDGPLKDLTGPREWQADVLRSIGERLRAGHSLNLMPVLSAISSGHGVGKSALVSWIVWWALSTLPDTRAVITANTEPQLRTKTWPEISKWARLAINSDWFRVQGMSIVAAAPDRAKSWRADAVTWSESNLEAFAGLHNKGRRILLVFDEASGIDDRVWDVAEGALTDEATEIVWLACGNPTRATGRFHAAAHGRDRTRWHSRIVDSRTVPGTNAELLKEWADAYGEDSDFMRVRVRGLPPKASSMQFITTPDAAAAAARPPDPGWQDALILGVDVARFGDDATVIAVRKGRDAQSIPWVVLRGENTMTVASRVAALSAELRADMVFIDGGGVGGGVVDRCRQLGVKCLEVQFGGKPDGAFVSVDGSRYANKRAEIWGAMREWMATGSIPPGAELQADLTGVEYGFTADNAILLERKQDMKRRGLASPDHGDALALTFAAPVLPRAGAGHAMAGVMTPPNVAASDYDRYA